MTDNGPGRTDEVPPPTRPLARVMALALALVAVSVAAGWGLPSVQESFVPSPWWVPIAVMLGYVLAERTVFTVEYRDDAMAFSVSEVPSAFALVFLDPLTAIVARLLGGLLGIVGRRSEAVKLVFNSALFVAELLVAYLVLHTLAPRGLDGGDVRFVVAIAVALLVGSVLSFFAVVGAISSYRGRYLTVLSAELASAAVTPPVVCVVAALTVVPALLDPWLAPLGLVPVVVVWWLLAATGHLRQRFSDLAAVHDFAQTVGSSLDVGQVARAAVVAAADELRAERATLLVAPNGVPHVVEHVGGGVAERRSEDASDPPGEIRLPIADGEGSLGELRLADRKVTSTEFGQADRERAVRLVDRLAATLRNSLLHADLEFAALHDPLTDGLNRRGFDEGVRDRLAAVAAVGDGRRRAVIVFDLDRFKEINDTFGHQLGDDVLVQFARRVGALLQPGELLARLGGDEFALFVERPSGDAVVELAESVIDASHEAIPLGEYRVEVAASAGVAMAVSGDSAEALLRRADLAMYAAKRDHTGVEVFSPAMDVRSSERLALLADLRVALDRGDLRVHLQPKLDLSTGRVIGAEALARWDHPSLGAVPPADFVRVAEESGLIRQLTDQVLCRSVEAAAAWAAAGYDLAVGVNLSALDVHDERLADRVVEQLHRWALDPTHLILEVTETSLLDETPRTLATLARLVDLGVVLSLDDFGTGYSSISYLRRLPAAELKVDRSFVAQMLLDDADETIVASMVDLGHRFGMRVVAEGIEDVATQLRLAELGCDVGQGYAIARPMPIEQFTRWLRSSPFEVARSSRRSNVVPISTRSTSDGSA